MKQFNPFLYEMLKGLPYFFLSDFYKLQIGKSYHIKYNVTFLGKSSDKDFADTYDNNINDAFDNG